MPEADVPSKPGIRSTGYPRLHHISRIAPDRELQRVRRAACPSTTSRSDIPLLSTQFFPPCLAHSAYSFLFPLTSQKPCLPSPFPPIPLSIPKNAYGSPSLNTSSPSLVHFPSPCLPSRCSLPAHRAHSIGFSAGEVKTMPAERTRIETSSSMVMSRGMGADGKVAVCSEVE